MQEEKNNFLTAEYNIQLNNNDYNLSCEIDDILNALSDTPVSIEELVEYTQLNLQIVYMILLKLELADKIIRLPGNKIIRKYINENIH
jgi:predicted Rossmann fold nucleotide-binding protein DprA/Smf involved in DNA uptake